LLLQMWMTEHLCHRAQFLSHGSAGKTCIEEFYTRVNETYLPEGVTAWTSYFHTLNASQIQWALGWLPIDEVIYMPAARPHFLLMGLKSIQPYAPHRVLRQLGRYQIVPKDEDLSTQVIEISFDGQFPEARVRQIWSQCQYLEANTCVLNQARGEVSPGYQAWYKGEMSSGRPAKRPHLQEFARSSQEHWDWLAKEREYLAEIGKLKQQIKDLKFENKVQVAADEGEKNKLARESEILKAQIRKMKMDADNQRRSRSDKRLIAGLRNQVIESRKDLERSEASIARIRARWAKGAAARKKHLWQVRRDYEGSIAILRETNSTLRDRVFKQARDARTDRERCYDSIARMEEQMERFQDQLIDNTRILGLKNQRIEQLCMERDRIRGRIDEIGRYITTKCLTCEEMPRDILFASVMGYVHRIMEELKSLQRGLAPKPAERPNDASRAPKFKALMYP